MATIQSLLGERVTLEVRSVDRVFLAGYVPKLQCEGQVVRFLLGHTQGTIPSPAILGRIGRVYVRAIDRFALERLRRRRFGIRYAVGGLSLAPCSL